jgi:hypothetical protein
VVLADLQTHANRQRIMQPGISLQVNLTDWNSPNIRDAYKGQGMPVCK